MGHRRNTDGLRRNAGERSRNALNRAEDALRRLVERKLPVTFAAVAAAAGVSKAWLYKTDAVRTRVLALRAAPTAGAPVKTVRPASDASKDTIIDALRLRIGKQDEEIKELRRRLEAAYGLLYERGWASPEDGEFRGVAGVGRPAPKACP